MDVELSPLTVSVSFFILVIMLLKLTSMSTNKSNLNLPPGPQKLPLIGNLHLLANSQPPHHTLRDLASKYGPLMQLQLGEVITIVVSSPQVAKEVMKTHDIAFASRPSTIATQIICYENTDIVFSPYGEYWRELRKICTLELLSTKRVQSFQPIREEEFLNLCGWIASNAGTPVNLTEQVGLSICGVVAQASFGKKTKEQDTFVSLVREMSEVLSGFNIGDLYPSVELFRLLSRKKGRLPRLHRDLDRILGGIVEEHKREITENNNDNKSKGNEDLVDVLLKFHGDEHELHLTMDNVKAVIMDMFAAGTETSTTAVIWAMSEMLKHPRILKNAQDEVRQVFENKGYVDETHLHELNYLNLVIKETLRLHPPLPLLLPKECTEQREINGYQIPAKATVLVNAWAIGRDPKIWKEPDNFKPERFLDCSFDYKGNHLEYIPFGAGRRICPGMAFGLINVKLPLAMFLYHFDWILPDGAKPEELDMTESVGLAVGRKSPLCAIPMVKRPLPA